MFRNAGGRLTEDAIRSFVMTQQLMGTNEVYVMHHTQCGVEAFQNQEMYDMIKKHVGEDASNIDFLPCPDARESVKKDVEDFKACKFIKPGTKFTGLMFDVATGKVEVLC